MFCLVGAVLGICWCLYCLDCSVDFVISLGCFSLCLLDVCLRLFLGDVDSLDLRLVCLDGLSLRAILV